MMRTRAGVATILAAAALAAGGSAVVAGTPAAASTAGYCGQGWNDNSPSTGTVTITSGLRTGPLYGCDSNGLAYEGDFLYVECYVPENGGWYFVDDWDRGDLRGWIPSHNFGLTGGMPGRC